MAVAGFNQLLESMAAMDFFTGVLPFVLTYVVLYAALDEVPVINDNDNFPPLIAVIGAFFVARFIVVNPLYQDFFLVYFGRIVVGLVGFIGLLILLAFSGYELADANVPLLMMLMIAIAGSAFAAAGGLGVEVPALTGFQIMPLITYAMESGLAWIVIVGIALWWASSDGSDDGNLGDYAVPFLSNDYWQQFTDDSD